MDTFEKDEVPMRSASISIPMNSMDSCEIENNFVSSERRTPRFHNVPRVMKPRDKNVQQWNKFFVSSCLVAVFLDPLFVFVFSVKQDHKCIVINRTIQTPFVVIRSMTDFIYLLHMLLQFGLPYVAPKSTVVGSRISLNFLIDVFVVLPLPQILILLILPDLMTSSGSGANLAKNFLLAAILVQYIPRLYRVLPMLAGQSSSGFIFESGWANFVINLLMFVLSGHVVGSCWYLFGLQRVNQCLRDACDSRMGNCIRFIDCGQGNEVEKFKNNPLWVNWTNNVNANACFAEGDKVSFKYGIYAQAVHLTTDPNLITKYVYSLFWGFQVSSMIS